MALALSSSCYTDAANADAERDLFASHWIGLGRSDQVPAGHAIARDVAGHGLVLVRDREGVLYAHANACRHRGARLRDGAGECRLIRCPFHAWAYRPDGSLVAAPLMEGADGFDKTSLGLKTYRVAERAGFIFACLNSDAPDIDDVLGNFIETHAPWPLEELVTTRRRELQVGCNWKAFLDVFNEYYHLPYVHADSIDSVYGQPDAPTEATGAFASQFGRTEGTGGLVETQQQHALPVMPGLSGRPATGARYTWVFPNMAFAANKDGLWVYEATPLGPDHCHVVQSACFHPETLEGRVEAVAAYHDRLDAALDEDIPALENQQIGLHAASAVPGPLHPLLEANVARFADWYRQEMGMHLMEAAE